MTDIPASRETVDRLILEACISQRVRFYWQPNWTLLIDIEGIDDVLAQLSGQVRILGFDTFTLEGKTVYPRLDFLSDYDEGISPSQAAKDITGWPRDVDLWIEVVADASVGS